MMNKERIRILLHKYLNSSSGEGENRELAELLRKEGYEKEVKLLLDEAWEDFYMEREPFSARESEKMLANILGAVERDTPFIGRAKWYYSWKFAAASILVAAGLATAIYLFETNSVPEPLNGTTVTSVKDVQPGTEKALLTLSDGRKISLNNSSTGLLATEGDIKIFKSGGDWLTYNGVSGREPKEKAYHTLRTPRGGQYHLMLPDGSKVWLNAASSITYPIHFSETTRHVRVEGEVYFEVAKKSDGNRKIPFVVNARDISVEVLGTQFNINAYQDEKQVSTTLLEGSVKVRNSKFSSLLDPGQEATVLDASSNINVATANTEQAVAWKNGFFQFREATLDAILRQLSKWYDVDVNYEGKPLQKRFSGEIPRSATLMEVLQILELNQIQVGLSGNRLTIKT